MLEMWYWWAVVWELLYYSNSNQCWVLEAELNQVVQVSFSDFDLEHTSGCTSDYVEAFSGEWDMMMSSNGNIFHVTGHLCGEFTGDRWIPRT